LSEPLKQHLRAHRFHSNKEVEMALHKWLWMQEPHLYHSRIFKLMPRWDKCINVLRDYVEK
jgi:hypothetical protein